MNEINKDFYCSAGLYQDGDCANRVCGCQACSVNCKNYHRKHPTPAQFKEEYGEEWKGAVYFKCGISNCTENCNNEWILYENEKNALADIHCATATEEADPIFICACTPFGMPDNNWRPE
jgi:hypothetical protein